MEDSTFNDKTFYVDQAKELFKKFHTFNIGEALAYSLSSLTAEEEASHAFINDCTCQIREIYKEFPEETIAKELATALHNLAVDNTLPQKYACVEEIKEIFQDYHIEKIASLLANALICLAEDNTPDEGNNCQEQIALLKEEFPDLYLEVNM